MLLTSLVVPQFVHAAERITSFEADITVRASGTITVTERIRYDFGTAERHGIYRTLPRQKQTGAGLRAVTFSNVSVTDPSGDERPFEISRSIRQTRIKIGNPDRTVTGAHTYLIEYTADGAIYHRNEVDELFWNVTGTEWGVPIDRASATVTFPDGAAVRSAACYVGVSGSDQSCSSATYSTSSNTATFSHGQLNDGEGLTVAASVPDETIADPGVATSLWRYLTAFSTVLLAVCIPIVTLVGMSIWWWQRGRDPRGRSTVVTQFEPPQDLSAPEAGVIEDQVVKDREFTAGIIELARDRHLKIHRTEESQLFVFSSTDYILERTGNQQPNDPFERELLHALFDDTFVKEHETDHGTVTGVALSDLKGGFSSQSKELSKTLYKTVTEKGYFAANPHKRRRHFSAGGILGGAALVGIGAFANMVPLTISGVITGIIIVLMSNVMPARTKKGVRAREHIAGFERYITVAEEDRLAFHNAPERTPERFDALLPYAVALHAEEAWARIFDDIDMDSPSWYVGGAHAGSFEASAFSSELSDGFSSAVSSSTASSGGGSVGGGAGGGGGGSW
jgi:uncharacterized membrane protein YgcG